MDLRHRGNVITFNGYAPENYMSTGTSGPDDPAFSKRILCEGDSWFSIGAIPSGNMLIPLKFQQETLLVNLAQPGDTIKRMSDISNNPTLHQLINKQNFSTKWDAIFISGGGNDLIDDADKIICKPSEGAGKHMLDYIDSIMLTDFKNRLKKNYMQIAKMREGSKNENTPIVCHLYDYPTPRNAKAKFLGMNVAGPWLYPAFKKDNIPEEMWISITDHIFEAMASAIIDISYQIKNFYVISSTPGTLDRAKLGEQGISGDWLNEIHPTTEGYRKFGEVVSTELHHILYQTATNNT